MNRKKEKWLDELISRTINTEKPEFDAERWKQKYPEEFQLLKSQAGRTPGRHVNIWTRIIRSPVTKLAAAAVIVAVIGLFVIERIPNERIENQTVPQAAKSPAEMLTAISLNIAYRKGGLDAVERQCKKAFKMSGPRSTRITVQQLLAEFNGNSENSERTKL